MTDKTRIISDNDMHVLMTQYLSAAQELHYAMCLFADDHFAQKHLRNAMHSVLIGAGECTRLHGSEKHRLPATEGDPRVEGKNG